MCFQCRRTENRLVTDIVPPPRCNRSGWSSEDDRALFGRDSGTHGKGGGRDVGISLWHKHASLLRNVRERPHGKVRNHRRRHGPGHRKEPEIRSKESSGNVSETCHRRRSTQLTPSLQASETV